MKLEQEFVQNKELCTLEKPQHDGFDTALEVFAREQIDYLTSQAWLTQNKQLEQKVAKLSLQTGFLSEYTSMGILEIDHLKKSKQSDGTKVSKNKGENVQGDRMLFLPKLGIGFSNLTATAENTPPGAEETKFPDGAEVFVKATTTCCGNLCNHCCCMCCIQVCTKMNNQCATAFSQLCIGLGCYSCLSCCSDICPLRYRGICGGITSTTICVSNLVRRNWSSLDFHALWNYCIYRNFHC